MYNTIKYNNLSRGGMTL